MPIKKTHVLFFAVQKILNCGITLAEKYCHVSLEIFKTAGAVVTDVVVVTDAGTPVVAFGGRSKSTRW